ncbi:hypothetical protein [Pseudomarimonas arenosa]|uniref:Uncharacterized protein n=1 Tax=Pseudomarimonas arenosa TaxID=2774145 RepID=A0AAW3ZIG2_9GAMM|nr:hypothetical protein [Pseudomarimonas arenosa]MBD8525873.1 hypothetical protein [Pseudomarimonas arenosa]
MLAALSQLIDRLPALDGQRYLGFSTAVLLAAVWVLSFDFVPILDHVNLAFHEAGHPAFGLFGNTMGWLGGTLGQFVFPIATTWHFARREQWFSAAACAIWFFENFRYVALYLGDARTQALPLVGGGEHDWAYLLGHWGLLEYDTRIAGALTFISWSGWLAVWGVVTWWWWRSRQRRTTELEAEQRERIIEQARQRERERRAKSRQ